MKIYGKGPHLVWGLTKRYAMNEEPYPLSQVRFLTTIIGILTFISMINTTSERLKAKNFFIRLF